MKSLRDLSIGQSAVVTKVYGEGAVRRRIMDMGITKGATIVMKRVAPLGDPIELQVRGYSLSIRKEDAQWIEIE